MAIALSAATFVMTLLGGLLALYLKDRLHLIWHRGKPFTADVTERTGGSCITGDARQRPIQPRPVLFPRKCRHQCLRPRIVQRKSLRFHGDRQKGFMLGRARGGQ